MNFCQKHFSLVLQQKKIGWQRKWVEWKTRDKSSRRKIFDGWREDEWNRMNRRHIILLVWCVDMVVCALQRSYLLASYRCTRSTHPPIHTWLAGRGHDQTYFCLFATAFFYTSSHLGLLLLLLWRLRWQWWWVNALKVFSNYFIIISIIIVIVRAVIFFARHIVSNRIFLSLATVCRFWFFPPHCYREPCSICACARAWARAW